MDKKRYISIDILAGHLRSDITDTLVISFHAFTSELPKKKLVSDIHSAIFTFSAILDLREVLQKYLSRSCTHQFKTL
jgi:hypothetical protein